MTAKINRRTFSVAALTAAGAAALPATATAEAPTAAHLQIAHGWGNEMAGTASAAGADTYAQHCAEVIATLPTLTDPYDLAIAYGYLARYTVATA